MAEPTDTDAILSGIVSSQESIANSLSIIATKNDRY